MIGRNSGADPGEGGGRLIKFKKNDFFGVKS